MKKNLFSLLCTGLCIALFTLSANAQFVNFEDTWQEFLKNNKISNTSELVKPNKDQKINYVRYCLIYANSHFCAAEMKEAEEYMKEIEQIGESTYSTITGFSDRYNDLSTKIEASHKVEEMWLSFLEFRNTTLDDINSVEAAKRVCEKGTLAKISYMMTYVHYCNGDIGKAKEIFEKRVLQLVERTSLKAEDVQGLPEEVRKMKKVFSVLPKVGVAWKEYMETDVSPGFEYDFPLVECNPIPLMKAYMLRAAANLCTEGAEMLKKIESLEANNSQPVPNDLAKKIAWLKGEVGVFDGDVSVLQNAWEEFVPRDTLIRPFELGEFYCDKMDQIKAWTIKGHLESCASGQEYLDKIDAFQGKHGLQYDDVLDCKIQRLRIKVWDCRYWEIVRRARKETHEERERFGPLSAQTMQDDLNSDKLPCETTVSYEPIGFIGIKYVITTYLCQEIDLAKMGDPEYYKKIATWVDTQVLAEYCEESMRCKEDFFINILGHSDGHTFRGARYRNSLEIPEGTPFTHFYEGQAMEKTTDREITFSLKNNMELGLARAWTVRGQLNFMEAPIKVGAYEHGEDEKGGQFRRIETELNMSNLLLDYYEKLLTKYLIESGIGERPEEC
ncbi:MAG: hypothetical protein AAF502_09690 [Bacteroidota bacterium]